MINPLLERRYADCTELIDAWKGFMEFFNKAIKEENFQPTPEMEQAFLDSKARIAMLHDSFMASLKHDQNVGQNMLSIVNRSITLRHLRKFNPADQKKIEIEWHECYLLLNETTSRLAEERERLAEVNEVAWKLGKMRERLFVTLKAFFTSIYFKIIVAVGILGGLIFAFVATEYDALRTVKGIGEPYQSFLDFRRDTMGMDSSYSSLGKLLDGKLSEEKLPDGFKRREQENKQDVVANTFAQVFEVDGTDAAEFLNSATEFKGVAFSQPDGPEVTAYLFYWFEPQPAKRFTYAFDNEASNPQNPTMEYLGNLYTVFYDNNVLVILGGPRKNDQEPVRRRVFKK
ncbi:MAG: hypothetical protein PWP23_1768 [Candidatus Sumerlaeota bacterium]|nr:hypothetical protein [Candidatus Sumerlaeota bacterium]